MHAHGLAGAYVFLDIIHENSFIGFNAEFIQRSLVDARIRFGETQLSRYDQAVKSIFEFVLADPGSQFIPGIADQTGFVSFAQGAQQADNILIDFR